MPVTMRAPTLIIIASLAIGFACQRRTNVIAPPDPAKEVSADEEVFEGEDSLNQRNLRFRAWPITADDGGLVGVAAEIQNLSKDEPLRMRSVTGSIPIGILLVVLRGQETETLVANPVIPLVGHQAPPDPRKSGAGAKYPMTEWTLPASGVKRYFIPLRVFASQLPAVDRLDGCTLHISLGAYPDWIPDTAWEPPFRSLTFPGVVLSKPALQLDYGLALAEFLQMPGRATKIDPTQFAMPAMPQ